MLTEYVREGNPGMTEEEFESLLRQMDSENPEFAKLLRSMDRQRAILALVSVRAYQFGKTLGRPPANELNHFGKWLVDAKISRKEAAKELDITVQHLSRLATNQGIPSLELAVKIEKMTKGAIPANSWGK